MATDHSRELGETYPHYDMRENKHPCEEYVNMAERPIACEEYVNMAERPIAEFKKPQTSINASRLRSKKVVPLKNM